MIMLFRYREGHSTRNFSTMIIEYLKANIATRKTMYTIYIDIKKAFDKIWQEVLIPKWKVNSMLRLPPGLSNRNDFQHQNGRHVINRYNPDRNITGSALSPVL